MKASIVPIRRRKMRDFRRLVNGDRVLAIRQLRCMTRRAVAARAGISVAELRAIERSPSVEMLNSELERLADALDRWPALFLVDPGPLPKFSSCSLDWHRSLPDEEERPA